MVAISNKTPISLTLFKLFIGKISTLITYHGQYHVLLPRSSIALTSYHMFFLIILRRWRRRWAD